MNTQRCQKQIGRPEMVFSPFMPRHPEKAQSLTAFETRRKSVVHENACSKHEAKQEPHGYIIKYSKMFPIHFSISDNARVELPGLLESRFEDEHAEVASALCSTYRSKRQSGSR